MRTPQTSTIPLLPGMVKLVAKTRRAKHQTRSELVRKALRTYIALRQFAEETPTPAALRAVRTGLGTAHHRTICHG